MSSSGHHNAITCVQIAKIPYFFLVNVFLPFCTLKASLFHVSPKRGIKYTEKGGLCVQWTVFMFMFIVQCSCWQILAFDQRVVRHVFTNKAKVEDEVTLFETWGLLRFQIKWGAKYCYCQIIVSIMSWPSDRGWGSMNVFAKHFFGDFFGSVSNQIIGGNISLGQQSSPRPFSVRQASEPLKENVIGD